VIVLEPGEDYVGQGMDLEPSTLVAAYSQGLFPMPHPARPGRLDWFCPDPRGVLPVGGLRVSRSLRRSASRFTITVDTAFAEVVSACADPRRPGGWITEDFERAYARLHQLGIAHSVEVRSAEGSLVGGLYGVSVGGLFAGESMFHRATDASKVALMALVDVLKRDGPQGRLIDVQWWTPHLASLGAVAIDRDEYLHRLAVALEVPPPHWKTPEDLNPRPSHS
jgi:leucyl/phenylalanyl-tRNA---protein transferase